jgi:hypothetical protein
MLEIAGGQLYWPLEQALHTDINYILVAHAGHQDLLKAIFGSGDSSQRPVRVSKGADGRPLTLTPNVFDVQFPGKNPGMGSMPRRK